LMKAGDMSMLTERTCSGMALCSARYSAKWVMVLASLVSPVEQRDRCRPVVRPQLDSRYPLGFQKRLKFVRREIDWAEDWFPVISSKFGHYWICKYKTLFI
jgi:hypothetical protein